ncbi:MAG: phage tail protein [Chloroflexales bacterium]|nr:phage tail protein [Chloroflexales bacterium]
MRPSEPTSWLLNGHIGWRTATADRVSVGADAGIRLAADPAGPLALASADGSLGGLTLPRGMALDDSGILYLLGLDEPWIKRFDPATHSFVLLPTIGAQGQEIRQFRQPRNIAIAGRNLYVADTGNRRVQVFDRDSLNLRHVWQLKEDTYQGEPISDLDTGKVSHIFLLELGDFAVRLRRRLRPLADYISSQLAPETRQLVDTYDPSQPPSAELRAMLTEDMDRLVRDVSLYTEERFRTMRLTIETRKLIEQNPQGDDRLRLNKRLLEEAYPNEIATRLWYPVDVTTQAGVAYLLDRRYGRVYRHNPGADPHKLVVNRPNAANRWSRVLVDRQGDIYLLGEADGTAWIEIYDQNGRYQRKVVDAGNIRDQFDAPPIRLDHKQRFCLPASLARLCDRRVPAAPPPEKPLVLCAPTQMSPVTHSPLLSTADFANLPDMVVRLTQRSDPVSRYLYGRLSAGTLKRLEQYKRASLSLAELERALLDDLNCMLQAGPLYTEPVFAQLDLTDAVRALIAQKPHGTALIRLNRLLIEAAYPGAFKHHETSTLKTLTFSRAGQHVAVNPTEPSGPYVYVREGFWFSQELDSQIYGCQWRRIELDLLDLPVGSQVVVSTYTDSQLRSADDIARLPDHLWNTSYVISGPMQAPSQLDASPQHDEFLVQSREGQYLWLKLRLTGEGYATPAAGSLRVTYPRESYLTYLPAVYAADDESRWFLERFLSIFQTEWDELERRIEDIAIYFDPQAVPAGEQGEFLAYLASLLALPLEGSWNNEQKRNLLKATPRIYPQRGTINGLRAYLQVYLQNITGLTPSDQQMMPVEHSGELQDWRGYPQIVEGFRERQRLLLSVAELADLGQGAPLWGAGRLGRLQLDVYAREGEVRLVSTGDPERDVFHEYAHRFRVFLPGAWVRTADAERMVRRALDSEKPAHTRYDLCLVEPRFRVGVQSTVGLDTIIGGYPVARLARQYDDEEAPSRMPRNCLGYDTILAGRTTGAGGLPITAHTRVGIDTLLT